MQDNSNRPAEQALDEAWSTILVRKAWFHRGIRLSVVIAIMLLAWDVAFSGSCVMSLLFCPIWFLGSILKNALQRPGWGLALCRIAIPAMTLVLVLANDAFQLKVAEENAQRIIAACDEFHAAKGRYPKTLDELVPDYLASVPQAKYCLSFGEFTYFNSSGSPMLMWCVVPPYGRKHFDFEDRRWGYLD